MHKIELLSDLKLSFSPVHASMLGHVSLFETPMDCSPPGSSIHGVFQARILEWVPIPFSIGSSQPRDRTPVSCIGR